MKRYVAFLAVLAFAAAGCSPSNAVVVRGTVTLDGRALPGAVVTFRPADQTTPGLGGSSTTDAEGKYTIGTGARGEKGLAPGEYVVIVSKRLRPDGSPPDDKIPPMESDAVEKLPPRYSDEKQSTLHVTVSKEKATHDLRLVTKKK
jgi:hypothetical protein